MRVARLTSCAVFRRLTGALSLGTEGGRALTGGFAAGLACLCLAGALPEACYAAVFCRLPASLAAAFFGAGVNGAAVCFDSGRAVAVTRACGGSDFFAMACGVLTWRALRQGLAWRRIPVLWAGAWGLTLLANGMRVITTVWTRAAAEPLLPERFLGAVHLVSGVMVFFPALAWLWWECMRPESWLFEMKDSTAGRACRPRGT